MTQLISHPVKGSACVCVLLAAALSLLQPVSPASGQPVPACFDNAPIQNSDPQEGGYFGTGIAADEDILVVGATLLDVGGVPDVGAAYVFWLESGAWVETQKMTPDVSYAARFGESVAMSDGLLAFAAPSQTVQGQLDAGAVYVYKRDESLPDSMEWQELNQALLTAEDVATGEAEHEGYFGGPLLGSHQGVAMDGRLLIVGSPGADVDALDGAGKAYIFRYDEATAQWSHEDTLESDVPAGGRRFGHAVAISGTRVIVGEYGANKAHIFTRDATATPPEWDPDGVLTETASQFGWSVALDGTVAVVGANTADKAYVYKRVSGSWQLSEALDTDDALGDDFGSCVSLDGSFVLVGARASVHPDTMEANVGAAYLFQRQNVGGQEDWLEVLHVRSGLAPFEHGEGECTHGYPDRMGETVLLQGDTAFMGSNADEFPAVGLTYGLAGLVYILDTLPTPSDCVEPVGCPP